MGSGYRVFTAGEVLTASNVQNYLQDQAVMVFGGTAARSSAIGTANFEEGMLTYLTDVDKLQVYTGAAFADVYPAAATNQGLTLINTTSFSGVASINVTSVFSATYTHYRINFNLISTSASERDLNFRYLVGTTPNTATNYRQQELNANSTSTFPSRATGLTSHRAARCSSATRFGSILDIFFPFQTERTQAISTQIGAPTGNIDVSFHVCELDVTTSYDGIQVFPSGDNITGSISVYGYNS